MLALTPVVCVCGGIVVSDVLNTYLDVHTPLPTESDSDKSKKSESEHKG